jgi:DNA replication and repair protein RecF
MYIRSLDLQQFRNYREASFTFDPKINLICGPNAQGKTNLLEAIHYLMVGRSFRTARSCDLTQFGAPSFTLEAIFCKHGVDQKLTIHVSNHERKLIYNSSHLSNASNLLGIISGVVTTPDAVSLIKGPPPLRRQFIDLLIARNDPLYVHYMSRYVKAMRHRNHLLRQKSSVSIEVWESEMARAAAYLIIERRNRIKSLQEHCQQFYALLSEEDNAFTLHYQSSASECKSADELLSYYQIRYQKNRNREMVLGSTLSGPHKDDLLISLGKRDTRTFASEGQQRSCAAALHLGEWSCLKETSGFSPLFMIDDAGIGLDLKRKEKLLNLLGGLGQVFVTATDPAMADTLKTTKKLITLPHNANL